MPSNFTEFTRLMWPVKSCRSGRCNVFDWRFIIFFLFTLTRFSFYPLNIVNFTLSRGPADAGSPHAPQLGTTEDALLGLRAATSSIVENDSEIWHVIVRECSSCSSSQWQRKSFDASSDGSELTTLALQLQQPADGLLYNERCSDHAAQLFVSVVTRQ